MNDYEVMVIVHPEADEETVSAINEQVGQWVSAQGGEMVKVDAWGRRKLAYAINKLTEGTYVVYEMRLPPTAVAEIDRGLRYHEQIVRYLIVRQDD